MKNRSLWLLFILGNLIFFSIYFFHTNDQQLSGRGNLMAISRRLMVLTFDRKLKLLCMAGKVYRTKKILLDQNLINKAKSLFYVNYQYKNCIYSNKYFLPYYCTKSTNHVV